MSVSVPLVSYVLKIWAHEFRILVFLCVGAKTFKIPCNKGKVQLTTRDHAIITKNEFASTIERFSSCAYFCVMVYIEAMDADGDIVVTPHVIDQYSSTSGQNDTNCKCFFQDIEDFLICVGATEILGRRNQELDSKSRQRLIRCLSEYIATKFSKLSTAKQRTAQKEAVAKAAVLLFPCMKSKSKNGGIVSC